MLRRRVPASALLVAALFAVACANPPNKEMDQAQGAIDAARAAGAEQYATTEYSAATTALKNANNAVTAGDYRLALNYALESREHAQNAARETADTKARVRAETEHSMAEIAALLAKANTRRTAAQRARVPRRVLEEFTTELESVNGAVQKAGEAMTAGDYLAAQMALDGVQKRIETAVTALDRGRR
jgi:ribosomal protein S20